MRAPNRATATGRALALALVVGGLLLAGPAPASAGSHDYTLMGARWNPCRTITIRIGGKAPFRGANREVLQAFNRMGRASGIHFDYRGRTHHLAWSRKHVPWDVTVTWTTPRTQHYLRGWVAGRGGWRAMRRGGGPLEIVSGTLVLDRTAHLRHGFPRHGAPSWGQVMMHEIGHVLGLGHAHGRRQLMYPVATRLNHRLGDGDRAGLRRVGRPAGCIRHSLR